MTTEIKHRSKRESDRFEELLMAEAKTGTIVHLHYRPLFRLKGGIKYEPSFRYADVKSNLWVYEEARQLTALLRNKIKAVKNEFGVQIKII